MLRRKIYVKQSIPYKDFLNCPWNLREFGEVMKRYGINPSEIYYVSGNLANSTIQFKQEVRHLVDRRN